MTAIQTTLTALALPFAFLMANLAFRQWLDLPRSASADTLIAIAIFQFVVVGNPSHFRAFIADTVIYGDLYLVFVFLLVLTIFAWFLVLIAVEPKIVSYDRKLLFESSCHVSACTAKAVFRDIPYPLRAKFLAFFLPLAAGSGTLSVFLYRS